MSLPPMHPALVHLPIAFVVLSFLADLAARMTRRPSLAHAAWWSLVAALIGGVLTIVAGYWDMRHATLTADTHGYVDQHLLIGWVLAVGLVVLTICRWRIRQQARGPSSPYLLGAFVVLALTLFQGWYGGEMVYSHGAGVAAAGQGTESEGAAQRRLARVREALTPLETAVGGLSHTHGTEQGHGESGK